MISRDKSFEVMRKYNKDPFHIQHALTVTLQAMAANEDLINSEMGDLQ